MDEKSIWAAIALEKLVSECDWLIQKNQGASLADIQGNVWIDTTVKA